MQLIIDLRRALVDEGDGAADVHGGDRAVAHERPDQDRAAGLADERLVGLARGGGQPAAHGGGAAAAAVLAHQRAGGAVIDECTNRGHVRDFFWTYSIFLAKRAQSFPSTGKCASSGLFVKISRINPLRPARQRAGFPRYTAPIQTRRHLP